LEHRTKITTVLKGLAAAVVVVVVVVVIVVVQRDNMGSMTVMEGGNVVPLLRKAMGSLALVVLTTCDLSSPNFWQ